MRCNQTSCAPCCALLFRTVERLGQYECQQKCPLRPGPCGGFFHTRTEQMDARLATRVLCPARTFGQGWVARTQTAGCSPCNLRNCGDHTVWICNRRNRRQRSRNEARRTSNPSMAASCSQWSVLSRRAGPFETNASLERPRFGSQLETETLLR